jgi:hypothetical protein
LSPNRGKRFYLPKAIQTSSGAHPVSCLRGARVLPRGKMAGCDDDHLHTAQRLRVIGTITLLLLYSQHGHRQLYFIYAYIFQAVYLRCHNQNHSPPHVQQALHIPCSIYMDKFYLVVCFPQGDSLVSVSTYLPMKMELTEYSKTLTFNLLVM